MGSGGHPGVPKGCARDGRKGAPHGVYLNSTDVDQVEADGYPPEERFCSGFCLFGGATVASLELKLLKV